jgi:hypothetical protein
LRFKRKGREKGATGFVLKVLKTVWIVDFETPVCKLYLLLISADAAKEKEKSTSAHWCFKVCSPYGKISSLGLSFMYYL